MWFYAIKLICKNFSTINTLLRIKPLAVLLVWMQWQEKPFHWTCPVWWGFSRDVTGVKLNRTVSATCTEVIRLLMKQVRSHQATFLSLPWIKALPSSCPRGCSRAWGQLVDTNATSPLWLGTSTGCMATGQSWKQCYFPGTRLLRCNSVLRQPLA